MPTKRRDWVFSLEETSATSRLLFSLKMHIDRNVKYSVFRYEKQGDDHYVLKGYIIFNTSKTLEFVTRFMPEATWHTPFRGGRVRNICIFMRGDQTMREFMEMGTNGPNYGVNHDYYVFDVDSAPDINID